MDDYGKGYIFDKLEALAMFWDITLRSPGNGCQVTMSLSFDGGETVKEFTGSLQDVILEADAWFDGVEFSFAPVPVGEIHQPD